MKRPNLLFLFSDQHSARTLGCYGNQEVKTPHLDALAARGVRLERAYCNNPICTPSRMCFTSGQYCHNHGYYGLMGPKPQHLPSLFSYFRSHGYRTGMAGKIHTPTGWLEDACDFVADGYGHGIALTPGNADLLEGAQGMKGDAYQQYLEGLGLGGDRDDKIIQEWAEQHPNHRAGQGLDARPSRLSAEHTIEAWTADQTCSFVERADRDQVPFCFWMTVPRPHQTYLPAQKFWDLYDESTFVFPPNADSKMEGRFIASQRQQKNIRDGGWMIFEPREPEAARRRVLRGYYGCVSQVDAAVGQVLATLDALGLRENTIVVYSTDHGEFAGEHGMVEKAPGIGFQCVTRIPQIWSWPGRLPENEVRGSLVESVDFLPTVAALAGLPPPDWVDGKDITPVLLNDQPVKEIAVTENPLARTITDGRYKLTQYLPEMNGGEDFGELFDLENDPWEMSNLYFQPKHAEVVRGLQTRLYQWLVRTIRNRTEFPSAPNAGSAPGFRSWDLAPDLRAQDGKIGPEISAELIRRGALNYM